MKLKQQVCTVAQAKDLNDLGIDLISEFAWCWNGSFIDVHGEKGFFINMEGFKEVWTEAYPAFTLSELNIMLLCDANDYLRITYKPKRGGMKRTGMFRLHTIGNYQLLGEYETEVEAAAAKLIYKLRNNQLTSEEVNKRLQAA